MCPSDCHLHHLHSPHWKSVGTFIHFRSCPNSTLLWDSKQRRPRGGDCSPSLSASSLQGLQWPHSQQCAVPSTVPVPRQRRVGLMYGRCQVRGPRSQCSQYGVAGSRAQQGGRGSCSRSGCPLFHGQGLRRHPRMSLCKPERRDESRTEKPAESGTLTRGDHENMSSLDYIAAREGHRTSPWDAG